MPNYFENLPPNWDDIEEECEYVPLTCPWTIACEDGTLTVEIPSGRNNSRTKNLNSSARNHVKWDVKRFGKYMTL